MRLLTNVVTNLLINCQVKHIIKRIILNRMLCMHMELNVKCVMSDIQYDRTKEQVKTNEIFGDEILS